MKRSTLRLPLSFLAQATIALSLVGGLLLAPPAEGAMMLVPLTPGAARALPSLALTRDTKLVSSGPLPGSLLVYARRADLAGRLLAHATLTLASPPGGCSAKVIA